MNAFRPSVSEERWLEVSDRFGDEIAGAGANGWRRAALFPRAAMFLLGLICSGAFTALVGTFAGWRADRAIAVITAVACIGLAEALIVGKRLWGYGFEEAAYLWGALALVVATFGDRAWRETVLVGAAIALTFVALRLTNPLFLTIAVGLWAWRASNAIGTSLVGVILWWLGMTAWLVLAKRFSRPSTQRMFEWLAIALPIGSYAWTKDFAFDPFRSWPRQLGSIAAMTTLTQPFLLAAGAAIALFLGIRWRQRALLIASFVCAALLAIELRELSGLSLKTRLIAYGVVLLAGSVIVERRLRRDRGTTSLPLGRDSEAWRIVQLGTAAVLATGGSERPSEHAPEPALEPGGGSFGGAGSSGSF
jgi:hypothetical protein